MEKQGMKDVRAEEGQFDTFFVKDVFGFVDSQLENIAEYLDQDQMHKFVTLMLQQLTEALHILVQPTDPQMEAEIALERQEKDLAAPDEADDEKNIILACVIRANDLINVADEFADFKEDCCYSFLTVSNLSERAASKFDECYGSIMGYLAEICQAIGRQSMQQSKIQTVQVLALFSLSQDQKSPNERTLTTIFDYILNFIKDFKQMLHVDGEAGKRACELIAEHLYRETVEIYIQRLLLFVLTGVDKKIGKAHLKDICQSFWLIPSVYDLWAKGTKEGVPFFSHKEVGKPLFAQIDQDIKQLVKFKDRNAQLFKSTSSKKKAVSSHSVSSEPQGF